MGISSVDQRAEQEGRTVETFHRTDETQGGLRRVSEV